VNHAQRVAALADSLKIPLLVTHLPNARYLSGFSGSSAYLLVTPGGALTFVTDGRYGELAESLLASIPDSDLVVYTSGLWDTLRSVVGGSPVALEADGVTWDFATEFAREIGTEPDAVTGKVERLRRTKDAEEVAALRAAAAAGDAAFAAIGDLAEPTITEAELGWRLIDVMRSRGGDAAGWEPIVAAGAGASVPHYRSGRKPVGSGLLLMDYGCVVDGYHSDMTRTVWLAGEPDSEMERVYRAVLESQEAGIAAVAPGVACGDVDEAVREVLRGYGFEKEFLHSTGHGVGLEIHEPPWLRRGNDDLLAAGDVVTVEPGVYLPGLGGVRIEDMVLVTEDGGNVLTASAKELV